MYRRGSNENVTLLIVRPLRVVARASPVPEILVLVVGGHTRFYPEVLKSKRFGSVTFYLRVLICSKCEAVLFLEILGDAKIRLEILGDAVCYFPDISSSAKIWSEMLKYIRLSGPSEYF